jgi:hypothetical protein
MFMKIHVLVEQSDVHEVLMELSCDGIQALEYVFSTSKLVTAAVNYHDLILALKKLICESRIKWHYQHIKGREAIPREQLDIWNRANNDCDEDTT